MACGKEDGLIDGSRTYRDLLEECGFDVTWLEFDGNHSWYSFDQGIDAAVKWLPTQDNFVGNVMYYGRWAHIDGTNFAHWSTMYNLEAEDK